MKRILFLLLFLPSLLFGQDVVQSSGVVEYDNGIDTTTTPTIPRSSIRLERDSARLWVYNHTTGEFEAVAKVGEGGGGGASQLSDLSDVNTSTPTSGNVLIADGLDFESRPFVVADISDIVNDYGDILITAPDEWEVDTDAVGTDQIEDGAVTWPKLASAVQDSIQAGISAADLVADVIAVTFDGGRDTLDCGNKAKRIFQINMGAITRTDTIDIINSVTGGEYLNHITNVVTDTMTWPGNLLTFAGDTLKTRQYTASTVNGFSFYGDGTNFYTLAATGNAATLPDGPPVFIDTIQSLDSLILYVRSDSITGLSNGNALPSWPDLSGESNNLAERLSNANRRPTYRTGEINGKPAVDFINSLDGNEDALSTANEIFLNDSCTLFIVYNMDDALTVTEFVFSSAKSDGTNFVHRFHYNSLDSLVIGTLDNSLVSRGGAYQDRRENTWKLATVTYEPGAVSTLRVNGNPISATHSSVASAAYGENVRLSLAAAVNVTGGTTTNEADVKIALVAVYNRKLTTSEIADVETFINNAFFP